MSSYSREEEMEIHSERGAFYGKIVMVSARKRKIRACEKDYAGRGTIGLSNFTGNAPGRGFCGQCYRAQKSPSRRHSRQYASAFFYHHRMILIIYRATGRPAVSISRSSSVVACGESR